MDPEPSAVMWIRVLLDLPAESGERSAEEWEVVRRRIEAVQRTALPRETAPAGGHPGPLLDDLARASGESRD